jgi:hypothetical protein
MKAFAIIVAALMISVMIVGCTQKVNDNPIQTAPNTTEQTPPVKQPTIQPVTVPDDIVSENPDLGAVGSVAVNTQDL